MKNLLHAPSSNLESTNLTHFGGSNSIFSILNSRFSSFTLGVFFFFGMLGNVWAQAVTTVFTNTGSNQTWVCPTDVTSITVTMWGAGGAGGGSSAGSGGSGAFVKGTLTVVPGTTYTIVVGSGGGLNITSAYGGGGASVNANSGGGGGYTGIFNGSVSQANALVIAGGGGGGAYTSSATPGGAGGGANGTTASGTGGGGGATTSAGGSGGVGSSGPGSAGTALQGGAGGGTYGSGGGGGYWGGGGGASAGGTATLGLGGGGGSSFTSNAAFTLTTNTVGTTNTTGAANTAPGSADANWLTPAGNGGSGSAGAGSAGRLVISYGTNYYWNGSGTAALSAEWNNTTPNRWSQPTSTTINATWPSAAGAYAAYFSSCTAASTVTLPGTIAYAPISMVLGNSNHTFTTSAASTLSCPITLAANTLKVSPNASFPLTLSGIISGTGGITNTTGTTILSGVNTYSGATAISSGTLKFGNAAALGTSSATTVTSGAALDLGGFTLSTARPLTLNGTGLTASPAGALTNTGGIASFSGAITLGSSATITATTSGTLTSSGAVSGAFPLILDGAASSSGTMSGIIGTGAGTVTKNGAGTWTLSASNTYTGATSISAGTLKLGAAGGATNTPLGKTNNGTTVSSGAVLDLNGFTLGTAEGLTLNGTGLTASPAGAMTNTGGNASYSGAITLGSSATITATTSGTLTSSGAVSGAFPLILDGAASSSGTMSGVIGTGTGTVTKNGAGTWTLSGANTYTGTTTISSGTLSAATIVVSASASNLGNASSAVVLGAASTSGTLSYTGAAASYTRGFTVNAGGGCITNASANLLTIGTGGISAGGPLTLTNSAAGGTTISSVISSTGSVVVNNSGAGTTTFSGLNTYTGGTTITAGTLVCGLASTIPSSGTMTLNGGTLSSGATTGFTQSTGNLAMTASSTINLGTGTHSITFTNSSALTWTGTLTITGWTGSNGVSGTAGKIFVGTDATGLTTAQLAQINFTGFGTGASILSTGEIVPYVKPEPTNQVTSLASGTITTSNIPLTWTSAVTGTQAPDGYLIKLNTSSVTDPSDGTDPTDATAISTGAANVKVATQAASSYSSFTGFTAGTMYNFKIYSYSNGGAAIDFKTTSVPSINVATLPNAATLPTFTSTTSTSTTINWTAPSGYSSANHSTLVFVKATSAVTAGTPTNAPSTYTANTAFGSGTAYQGDASAYCVYKGDGTSVTVTGLSGNTAYNIYILSVVDATNSNGNCSYSAGLAGSTTTLKIEPTNQITNLAAGTVTTAAIPLTWTAAVAGSQLPDGYLVKLSSTSLATITDPVDGTDPADVAAITGGLANKKQTTGAATSATTFTGMTAGTMYYYKVYSYTNTGTGIDFKTGSPATLNHATLPNAATLPVFASTTATGTTLSWTTPSGYSSTNHSTLVFVKATSAVTAGTPTNNPTSYTANTAFGSGTAYQGDASAYCVYNGDGTSVSITGLSANTAYNVYILSVVDAANSNGNRSYSAGLTGSVTTACAAISSFPWSENFDAMSTVGSTYFPNCWLKENGGWSTGNASSSSYTDPQSSSNYLYIPYTQTNSYVWTPGFQLTANVTYNLSFYHVTDGYSGWTDITVYYNSSQVSTGSTQLGSQITSPTYTTYSQVLRTFTPSSSGTYYFGIKVNANGTPWSMGFDDFSLCQIPNTPGSISGTTSQCPSLSSQTYSISAVPGATSYTWTVPTGWSITAGSTTNSITVTTGTSGQNGNITVTATNTCGTSSASSQAVTVLSSSTAPVITSTICNGGTSVSGTGIDGSTIAVKRSGSTIGTATVSSGTWTATVSTLATSDAITATQTEVGICVSGASNSVTVGTVPGCISTFSPANASTGQSANGISITWSAVSTATSYDVYFGTDASATNILNGVNQSATSYSTVSMSGNTTYYWKVVPRNSCGAATGCTIYSFTTGAVCTPPSYTYSSQNVACYGLTTGSISISASSGQSPYQYSNDGGSTWGSSSSFSSLAAGSYTIIVKGNDECVGASNVVTITQPSATLSASSSGAGSGCQGSTLNFTGSVTGGTTPYSYSWSPSTGLSSSTAASPTLTIATTANYTLAVTDANGCTSTASALAVTNNSPAAPTASDPAAICAGESANLVATSAGNSINWYTSSSGGSPVQSYVTSGGSYSVSPSSTTIYYAEALTTSAGTPVTNSYSYTGSEQTFTVPDGVTSINVKMWGAGGGGSCSGTCGSGGSGAFVKGDLAVSPGQTIKIVVGQGGAYPGSTTTYGGGGSGGTYGGSGGGYSGIFLSSVAQVNSLAVVGGGGGGGYYGASTYGGGGGATSGSAGGNQSSTYTGGGGASLSAGGSPALWNNNAAVARSGLIGGILSGASSASGYTYSGGGGGGGYYGGGSGYTSSSATYYSSGGGGGSSYTSGLTNLTNTAGVINSSGAAAQAPNSSESGYSSGIGNGGTNGSGGNGLIVITYSPPVAGCTSPTRTPVTVTVNSVPSAPSASVSGSSTVNVGGTAVLTATGTNVSWYSSASGGSSIGSGSPFTTPVQCASGSVTYYAEDVIGSCISTSRGSTSITVRPMLSSNPSNALICSAGGSVTMSTQLTGGSSISWSPSTNLSATSGSSTIASPTVTTQYTMSATVAGCGSVSATQTIGVIESVSFTPTATQSSVCSGQTSILASNLNTTNFSATCITGSNSLRTAPGSAVTLVSSNALTASGSLPSGVTVNSSTSLDDNFWSGVPIGFNYNYFGENATSVFIGTNGTVVVNVPTAVGSTQYDFSGGFPNSANPAATIAVCARDLRWDQNASGSIKYWTEGIAPTRKFIVQYAGGVPYSGDYTGRQDAELVLNETTGIVEIYIVKATNNGASPTANSQNKYIGLQDKLKTTGATSPNCSTNAQNYWNGVTDQINAGSGQAWKFVPAADYTFQWATAGSNISGATTSSYTTEALSTPGTVTYSVSATNPNTQCATTQTVNVTVNERPAAPVSSGNVTACSTAGNQTLTVTTGTGVTADWYAGTSGGTVLTSGTGTLTYSTGTANTYYAEARNSTTGCVSTSRTGVTLNVNTSPSAPTVTTPVTYCQGATASTLSATAGSGNTLNWYTAAPSYPAVTGATSVGSAPTPSTASAGTTNYYVSQSSGSNSCESQLAQIAVTVNATPSAPTATDPSAYCQNATASALTATSTGGNTLYWYTVPTGGSGSTTAPTPSTSTAGTTSYYVADRNNTSSCEGTRTTITVTVNPSITASVSNSASSTSACGGGSITFTATPTNGGSSPTYQWYLNGAALSGETNPTYTLATPSNADAVYVAMTPSAQSCLTSSSATNSSTITLTSSASTPTVAIQTSATSAICPGTSVTFSVNTSANMGASPTYVWKKNGTAITGETSSTYVSTDLLNNDQITLEMTSSLNGLCLTQSSATSSAITTTVNTATSITTQPVASSACSGSSANFSVVAAGQGTLTYQWKKNGTNISGNATATTSTLTLSGIVSGDAADYTVVVTGTCGSVTSSAATLSISTATAISSQPAAVTQCAGTTANFSVTAAGQGTLSYQWRKDGSAISGATSSTLAVSNIATVNAGQYSVVVTGGCGNLTSSNALLTVNAATTIASQPSGSTICAGTTANFSVTATGTGALTYQWKKDGSNVGTSSSSLAVSNAQVANSGIYTVDVSGTCGTVTSNNATLTVNAATSITTQPQATAGCEGQNTTFTVVAAGTSPLSYQWKFGGANISGATSASYNIPSTSTANDGNYSVVVTGGCGNATSSTVALNVYGSPTTSVISTADQTSSAMCGVNTLNIVANDPATSNTTGTWSVVGSASILITDPSLSSTSATAANSALGGTTKKLVWTLDRVTSSNHCYSRDTLVIDFKQPITTTISGTVVNGDYLWGGLTDNSWSTSENWYQYQVISSVGAWIKVTSGEPTSTSKVYTLSNTVAGACVSSSNSASIGNGDAVGNIVVQSGSTLYLSSGSLSVTADIVNNGTINPGTGTVTFSGTGNQTISGSSSTLLNNMTVDKASGYLTISQPIKVTGTLSMIKGDVYTDVTNIIELGSSANTLGTLSWTSGSIVGPMKRWFAATTNSTQASGLFPVGGNVPGKGVLNRYAQVNFTSAPGTGGYIIAEYKTGNPGLSTGLPIWTPTQYIQNYEEEGYWDLTPYNSSGQAYQAMNTTPYTLKLRLNTPSTNDGSYISAPERIRIISSKGPDHSTWVLAGTQGAGQTQTSQGDYLLEETGVTGFSWFNGGGDNFNPLPVTLTSFSGNCEQGEVSLEWKTASEHNSAYFEVEKSRDGENWQVLTTVTAAGNSNQTLTYNAMDVNAGSDNNYYRLKQVDIDGSEKLYNVINVGCTQVNKGYFSSFPNPSGSTFQLVVNDKNVIGRSVLNINDSRGVSVLQRELDVQEGINMFVINEQFAPGIYFINISNGKNSTEVIRQSIK